MSLILEALRKLEREKQTPERGFLVMAHTPWGAGRRWSTLTVAAVLLVAAALASVLTAIVLRRGPAPGAPAPTAAFPLPAPRALPVGVEPPVKAAPLATTSTTVPSAPPMPAAPPPDLQSTQALGSAAPSTPAIGPSPRPAASPLPDLRLLAISQQDGRPVAVVNDRLVREGDSFEGIRILRIGATEVEIEVQGKKRVLTFQ